MSTSRVAVVRCDSYEDQSLVDAAVLRGIDLIGGAGRFIHAGERIVLKPNLLVASAPDKAVTTNPAVFEAVAKALSSTEAVLSWGDSPGFGSTEGAGRKSGIALRADALGIPMADFHHGRQVPFHEGTLVKQFTIAEGVLEADGLVTLPKLKTHALTRMTGAVKNQFGCIPGMLKGEFHAKMPDVDRFCQMLVDLNLMIRPRFAVMDAVVAMEGNGPRSGDPRFAGVLIISDDLVAVDVVGCRIMGLDPNLVGTIVQGDRLGLGTMSDIEIVGDDLPELADFVANRDPASTTGGGFGSRIGRRLLAPRPYIVHERCTRCGTCVKVCPVTPKAVDFPEGDGSKVPEHHYGRCIRCYCCQEMCPEHAIEVKSPLLGRVIRR